MNKVFCPYCGKEEPINSIAGLLAYCDFEFIDPVNFYEAFPLYIPIPQSCTGATPWQIKIIISLVIMRRRNQLPVTIESIAGPSDFHIDMVRKVFEELHISESEVTE